MKQKKMIHLEMVRIISIFCIVFNHVGYDLFIRLEGTEQFASALILIILSETSVPLFFMISGAVLLKKEESWADVYKNRVLRIAEVIVLFTVVRFLYECFVVKTMAFSSMQLIKSILTCNIVHPYWFLYAYLSLLLLLPIFRIVIKNLDRQGMNILLILIIVFYMIIPMKSILINQDWKITLMLDEKICYLFLGYYIEHEMKKEDFTVKKQLAAVFGIIIAVMISFAMVVKPRMSGGEFSLDMITALVMPLSCAVFFLIRAISLRFERTNERVAHFVLQIGSCVFGVYLIEDYLRALVASVFGKFGMYWNSLGICVLATIVVIIIGIPISYVMKKIPILKKLV